MPEFGIWSDESGGFVEAQCWSRQEALDRIMELGDEAPEDAEVLEVCPVHPEQPAWCCEDCNTEDEEA